MAPQSSNTSANAKKRTRNYKPTDLHAAPAFLRKTYRMIDTCDPSIATWSDDGTTFVVKDVDKFAATIIPDYFKHSNFSSFVRQLNFYGFRKIKSDTIRLKDASAAESKFWKFRHEKFRQGHEEMILEIRKSSPNDNVDKNEVDNLKAENQVLKKRLAMVESDLQSLKDVVAGLVQNEAKRMKLASLPVEVTSASTIAPVLSSSNLGPAPVKSLPDLPLDVEPVGYSPLAGAPRSESNASGATFTSQDEAMLQQILMPEFEVKVIENNTPDVHLSALPSEALSHDEISTPPMEDEMPVEDAVQDAICF